MPEWIHTLTVDASYDRERDVIGVGIVIQERVGPKRRGPILAEIAEAHAGVAPGSGEALAVLRALEIARERGYTRVRLRSDCNWPRRALREQHREGAAVTGDPLKLEILRMARTFEWIDFGYVPRRKNQAAHGLARQGRFFEPGVTVNVHRERAG
jgi:ribonuclease HI